MNYPLRTWLEIDRKAFDHNISCYHAILGPQGIAISVVIKSNAYGHGIEQIARLCQENEHISYLCVVMLSEAIQLSDQGITKPILVMGIIDQDPELAIHYGIDLLVYSKTMIDELHAIAARMKKVVNIHLKVDTGLSRLGFEPNEVLTIARYIQTLPFMNIRGMNSHFAESNNENLEFTNAQLKLFNSVTQQLEAADIRIPIRHMANSAGSTTLPMQHMTMVRLGAGALGLSSSAISLERTTNQFPFFDLQPILSWHTRIMHIRTIPEGQPVGYDRTYTTDKETKIALLPVGYADGYNRRLSNVGHVLLKKQACLVPIIGRIAMNLTTIDITSIPDAQIGDEIVLLGKDHPISAGTLAELTQGYNAREITVQINQAIPRIISEPMVSTDSEIPYTRDHKNLKDCSQKN